MNKLLASLCIALFAQAAHADIMKAEFNVRSGTGAAPSIGSLTLTLNQDGSIGAALDIAAGQDWYGLGIDSDARYAQWGFTQGSETAWGTAFGTFYTGLVCDNRCSGPTAWTIGAPGQFTSVQQILTGNYSTYDAWFYAPDGQYAGMMAATSAVPEPASLALLGLGLAGVAAARRRKHA